LFAYEAAFLESPPILFAPAGGVGGQISFLPAPDALTARRDCTETRQRGDRGRQGLTRGWMAVQVYVDKNLL